MNERHSGFPGLALGGYVAGVLAASSTHVGALEVRLHRAVRIGDEFELQPDGAALMHDAEAVATARPVALDLHPPKIITREAAETASASNLGLEHHFDPAEILFVEAGQDGVLHGMTRGVLSSGPSDAAHLFGMYVGPAFRGQGYGRRLVEEVCDWARRAGEHRIILDVTETDLFAIRLYEACGFARTGRTQPLPHTPALQEIEMECALG